MVTKKLERIWNLFPSTVNLKEKDKKWKSLPIFWDNIIIWSKKNLITATILFLDKFLHNGNIKIWKIYGIFFCCPLNSKKDKNMGKLANLLRQQIWPTKKEKALANRFINWTINVMKGERNVTWTLRNVCVWACQACSNTHVLLWKTCNMLLHCSKLCADSCKQV